MAHETPKKFFAEFCDKNPDEAERLMRLMQQAADVDAPQPVDAETLNTLKMKARFIEERQRIWPCVTWRPEMKEIMRQYVFYIFEKHKPATPVPPSDQELSELAQQGADVQYIKTGERAFEPLAIPVPPPFYVTLEELIAYDQRIDALRSKPKKLK